MRVEILHIEQCPNWVDAETRVHQASAMLQRADASMTARLLRTSAEAAAVPFAGSPTILIGGVDAFPTGGRTTQIACRVFSSDQGLSGLPTVPALVEAFQAHP